MKRQIITMFLATQILLGQMVLGQTNQPDRGVGNKSNNQTSEKRLALVIGNGSYKNTSQLANPVNDANDTATALKSLGFEVLMGTNQNKREMEILIRQFGEKLAKQNGVGLFFYAGHGLQVNGNNYLVPIEADIPEQDEVEYQAVNLSFLLGKMGLAGNNLNIVILDACRNNPFARSWRNFRDVNDGNGLAKVTPPTGTIMLYATQPGNVASDGTGRNGLFTESLLQQIKKPNVELDAMVKLLARDVSNKSNGKQIPWKEGIVLGDFYFAGVENSQPSKPNETQAIVPKPTPLPTPTPVIASNNVDAEGIYWKTIEERNTKSGYDLYLAEYPNGKFAKSAKDRITEFNNQEAIRLKNIEKSKWQDAVQENTKASYNAYLNSYSNGEFATTARQKIKAIENEEARIIEEREKEEARKKAEAETAREQNKWDEVSTLNRKSAYQSYLADYPNGKYSATAKQKIKEFENEEARILLEQQKAKDKTAWEEAERLKTIKGYEDYLKAYPKGDFASLARLRLNDLGKTVLPTPTSSNTNTQPIQEITNSIGIKFVKIPGKTFYMGKYEVTQAEWQKVMGNNPSEFKWFSRLPIENVSWDDVQEYITKLNTRGIGTYRLPTEDEWEYSARAGTTTDFYWGNDENLAEDYAWYNSNASSKTHPVGLKKPNGFGLYDMAGNVWEWCEDNWNSTTPYRVNRGGGWSNYGTNIRYAFRRSGAPSDRYGDLGFRLLREN